MRSRQKPAANFTRRPNRPLTSPEIVEVDPTPFETVPIEIIARDNDSDDAPKDHIPISGPLPPMSVLGVSSSKNSMSTPSRPKKSLFARQQEQKRSNVASSMPSSSKIAETTTDEPEIGILSDLVERDVVSFSHHLPTPANFESTETGFPESEKIEFPSIMARTEAKSDALPKSSVSGAYAATPIFYSSSRDRLEPTHTLHVVNSGEDDQNGTREAQESESVVEASSRAVLSEIDSMMEEVSRENDASMAKMSSQEVERLQQELAAHLNPKFIHMLKERGLQKASQVSKVQPTPEFPSYPSSTATSMPFRELDSSPTAKRATRPDTFSVVTSTGVYSVPPTKGSAKKKKMTRSSNFLADIERKKREWMLPIQPSSSSSSSGLHLQSESHIDPISRMENAERNYMAAEWYRFDFEGQLLSYPTPTGNVQLQELSKLKELNALLHHGDDPTEPGYTLDELAHLSRSAHPSQRISALRSLGCIIFKAKHAHYSLSSLNLPVFGSFEAFPNNLFISHLIQTLNLPLVLRIALDDSSNTQIVETLYGLHALLCSEADDAASMLATLPPSSIYTHPLNPRDDYNISQCLKDWDDKSDSERCEVDLVLALLQTGLLSRLRYILESKPSPISTVIILHIMRRCARHSQEACEHFQQCPGLLPLFKKLLVSTPIYTSDSDSTVSQLIISLINLVCKGSRKACEASIQLGLISACFKFLYIPSVTPKDSENARESAVSCTIETLGLIETCLRYGLFRSATLNILTLLLDLVSDLKISDSSDRKLIIQAATWRLLSAIVPLARDIPEGEEIPSYVVLWSHISPMVPQALSALRQFDLLFESQGMTSDADCALASILEFLAAYFRQLELHLPRSFEEDKAQVKFISQTTIAPFLISSSYFCNLVLKLSSQSSWRSSVSEPLYFNVVPNAAYTVSLTSHPSWSWKAQRLNQAPGGGTPMHPSEQTFSPLSVPNVKASTLLHQSSVLLSALRVVDAINVHDPWLSASLTASEISNPLVSALEHYSSWAMTSSGSVASIYAARSLHQLAYQIISLLYRSSIVAQEAALVCIAHLLPGDELLAKSLLLRITAYYTPQSEGEVPLEQSLAKRLQIAPGLLAYLLAIVKDGLGGSTPRSSRLLYLTEENHPVDRESLLLDVEGSAQPMGKHWVYKVFSHYAHHRAIEEDELAQRKQTAKSDAIQRGVEAYLKAHKEASAASASTSASVPHLPAQADDDDDDDGDREIEIELQGDLELVGDYEDAESKRALAVGVSLMRDSLRFVMNVESSNSGFALKMKRHVKLYAIMQVFSLGPKFFVDDKTIAELLRALLDKYLERGWEPVTLHSSVIINTTILEKLVEVWANESFGDANIGYAVALWLSAGSDLNAPQISASGQRPELKALDAAIWPHFATLWHLLPEPPKALQKHYFQENIVHRTLASEYLLLAFCSPHCLKMRQNWHFWYRFIVFQISRYFQSSHADNVNGWIRLNALQSLVSDLGHLDRNDHALLWQDIFTLTAHDLEASKRKEKAMTIAEALGSKHQDPVVESLLVELRKTFCNEVV